MYDRNDSCKIYLQNTLNELILLHIMNRFVSFISQRTFHLLNKRDDYWQ